MPKSEYIHLRVAPWEKEQIERRAKRAGKTTSEFVRKAALGQTVIETAPLRELTTELRRQGNNLNQLVVLARQGRISFVDLKPFLEVYRNTWQALNSLLSRGA